MSNAPNKDQAHQSHQDAKKDQPQDNQSKNKPNDKIENPRDQKLPGDQGTPNNRNG